MKLLSLALAAGFLIHGQEAAKPPAFEVVSVRLASPSDTGSRSRHASPGTLHLQNQTLRRLIGIAYNVRDFQIEGGPKWIDVDRYDISAKAAGPASSSELTRMLQTLLADRFQLVFHTATKPYAGYALVAGKLRLKPSASGARDQGFDSDTNHLAASGVTLAEFAEWLARRSDGPVVDETRTTGRFDFTLDWVKNKDDPGPDLFRAIEDQLGMRLEERKVLTSFLIVDRAEKSTEN